MIRRFSLALRGVKEEHETRPRIALAAAAALTALAPLTVAASQTHTIAPGETLSGIAATYGLGIAEIAELNGIVDPDLIFAGATLLIPGTSGEEHAAPVTYTVARGDTLAQIAGDHGVSVSDLAAVNALADPDFIVEGQVLTIATAAAAVPAAPAAPPSEEVRAILREVETEFGIPAGLLQALAWQESGWQQHVISNAGAVGVTQVLPVTALWALEFLLGTDADWEESARDNARVGASVLRHYLNLTEGDVHRSLAAYYQGWQSVQDFGIFPETEGYIANVMALWEQFA